MILHNKITDFDINVSLSKDYDSKNKEIQIINIDNLKDFEFIEGTKQEKHIFDKQYQIKTRIEAINKNDEAELEKLLTA